MRTKGPGLAGKLIIIFGVLYALLLGGVLALSVHFFTRARRQDAHYRIADAINSIYLGSKHMSTEELSAYISGLFSSRFQTPGYDLDIVEVTLRSDGVVLTEKSEEPPQGRIQRYHAEIRGQRTGRITYAIDVAYSLANLEKGILRLVWQVVVIGLAALAVGIVFILIVARRTTAPLRSLAGAMKRVGEGELQTRIKVRTSDEVGQLGEAFNWMMRSLEEAEFVKTIFKRYVTRQVAEKILADRKLANLEGDRREVSILFADIRGFTSISRKMPPEEVIALLNHYFAPLIDIIIANEGVLDKFMGDGFLAFWNAPVAQKDYALRACRTALDIRNQISRLNLRRENRGEVQIKMGMGVHTGTAIAGNIGSHRRMEYTIIGESVNFAERLQEAASGNQILVSTRTRKLVGERLSFRPQLIRVEGYGEEEIEVFQLVE